MEINILICDEDKISLKITATYIDEFSQKYKIKTKITGFSTIDQSFDEYIQNTAVDVAILETDLLNSPGVSLAKQVLKQCPWTSIIFITSHTEYAMEAFNLLALGYLQKPIRQLKLEKLFARAAIQAQSIKHRKNQGVLSITVNKSIVTLKQMNIVYIEKIQQKTRIVTTLSSYETYETLTSIEAKLGYMFIRINQSIIVNLEDVTKIDHSSVYIKTGKNFKIGRTYVKKVKEYYTNFSFTQ